MLQKSLKSLLVVGALAVSAADASSFEWSPSIQTPNPAFDVTAVYAVERLTFQANGVDGAKITDVMPLWIDEDGNEMTARSGAQNPNGWDLQEFSYSFSISDFKGNGEYTLVFPEGLIVNAAGEKSDRLEWFYTLDISELAPGMFEDFEVLSITPDLSQPQAIWSDQVVTLNTNHNDAIGLTRLTITDTTTGEVVMVSSSFASGRTPGDDTPISWEVVGTYKFYEEHLYRADIVFYNGRDEVDANGELTKVVDRVSFEFEGRVEGYKYSPVKLLSVEPDPASVLISETSQAVFTYTFSGPVSIYQADTPLGQNGKNVYPLSSLSSNADKTVWTLDLSKNSFVLSQSSTLLINVYASDADGYHLQGNEGSEDNSCFQYEWECELGAVGLILVSPTSGAAVNRLSEVVVQGADGANISWTWMGVASIRRDNGEELGRLSYGDGSASAQARFSQWIPVGESSPIPLNISEQGSYTVSFSHGCFYSGPESNSRQTHSASFSFSISPDAAEPSFDDFTVLSVSPDLSLEQGEWSDQKISLNTNYNSAVGLVTLTVTDQTDGDVIIRSSNSYVNRLLGDDSEISWSVYGDYTFLKDHKYRADFVFYNGSGDSAGNPGDSPEVGRASYRFDGSVQLVPEFKYSSLSLESVEPDPESFVVSTPDKAVFKYTFTGPVEVYRAFTPKSDGQEEEYSESCLSSNADKTVWTLDLSANQYVDGFEGKLAICLFVRDLEGYVLKGNYGEEDDSCFLYEWECALSVLPVSIMTPMQGSAVETLTEVIVKSTDGLSLEWSDGVASLNGSDGVELGRLVYVPSSDIEEADAVRFNSWIPVGASDSEPLCIEEKGEYSVSFSTGCFLVGTPPQARRSLEAESSFTVEGRVYSRLSFLEVSPAPMSEVISSPQQAVFRYAFSGPVDVYMAVTPLESGEAVAYPASCLSFNEDKTVWSLDLSSNEYVLGLDGRLVIDLYARDSDGYPIEGNLGEGEDSCFHYEWDCTVGAIPEATDSFVFGSVDPESGSPLTSLSQIRISYSESAVALIDSVDIYMEGEGAPVRKASFVGDLEDDSIVCVVFEDPIFEAGVYTVVIPAGAVGNLAFSESEGKTGFFNPEFSLVYIVEPEDDAVDLLTIGLGQDVFDINGRLVLRNADKSALGRLAKGMYICNAKKIIIK